MRIAERRGETARPFQEEGSVMVPRETERAMHLDAIRGDAKRGLDGAVPCHIDGDVKHLQSKLRCMDRRALNEPVGISLPISLRPLTGWKRTDLQ